MRWHTQAPLLHLKPSVRISSVGLGAVRLVRGPSTDAGILCCRCFFATLSRSRVEPSWPNEMRVRPFTFCGGTISIISTSLPEPTTSEPAAAPTATTWPSPSVGGMAHSSMPRASAVSPCSTLACLHG